MTGSIRIPLSHISTIDAHSVARTRGRPVSRINRWTLLRHRPPPPRYWRAHHCMWWWRLLRVSVAVGLGMLRMSIGRGPWVWIVGRGWRQSSLMHSSHRSSTIALRRRCRFMIVWKKLTMHRRFLRRFLELLIGFRFCLTRRRSFAIDSSKARGRSRRCLHLLLGSISVVAFGRSHAWYRQQAAFCACAYTKRDCSASEISTMATASLIDLRLQTVSDCE